MTDLEKYNKLMQRWENGEKWCKDENVPLEEKLKYEPVILALHKELSELYDKLFVNKI